jgi:hypothetical protein
MPQIDFDGANSLVKTDKIQGQSGTTVTVPTGHTVAITDADRLTIAGTAVKAGALGKVLSTDSASDTGYEIRRDSTDLQQGTGGTENSTYGAFMNEIGSSDAISASGMLLDSPSTTSAVTYKILARPNSTHALVINKRSSNDSLRVSSSMILMEIGA